MQERALDDLRVLADRDGRLEEESARLRALDGEVAAIRRRAEEIAAFFALYAAEERRLGEETGLARAELERRREELAAAEAELSGAQDEEGRAHAERAVDRARDHVGVAETRVARAIEAERTLEAEEAAGQRELPELEERARAVAGVPEPAADLAEWASRAHAELFVAARQIDGQRERLIREANELASALLGEATYGSTAAQALARAEARFASSESAKIET